VGLRATFHIGDVLQQGYVQGQGPGDPADLRRKPVTWELPEGGRSALIREEAVWFHDEQLWGLWAGFVNSGGGSSSMPIDRLQPDGSRIDQGSAVMADLFLKDKVATPLASRRRSRD